MKRAVILILLATLILTGCAAENQVPQEPYTQYVGNTQFLVDPAAMTITAQGHEFTYEYVENGVSITYPNGAVCTESDVGIGWSNADADFTINNGADYIDCYMLLIAVPEQAQNEEKQPAWPLIIAGIAFISLGAWMCARPHTHWRWNRGWKYKNAEPSDMALGVIGAVGIIEIIVGIAMILTGIFA